MLTPQPPTPQIPPAQRELIVMVFEFAAMLLSMAIWSVVGLFVWFPLLVRKTGYLVLLTLRGALIGQSADAARPGLQSAARFYPSGFRLIYNAFYGNTPPIAIRGDWEKLIMEALWASAIWCSLLLTFSRFRGAVAAFFATDDYIWVLAVALIAFIVFTFIWKNKSEQKDSPEKKQSIEPHPAEVPPPTEDTETSSPPPKPST
jgi:hypothetical protein